MSSESITALLRLSGVLNVEVPCTLFVVHGIFCNSLRQQRIFKISAVLLYCIVAWIVVPLLSMVVVLSLMLDIPSLSVQLR